MQFVNIAIGGSKAAGKTTVRDYLLATRGYLKPLNCKTPIVRAWEAYRRRPYVKAQDDADLIEYSTNILRKNNPNVVVEYLEQMFHDPQYRTNVVIDDMRFPQENDFFRSNGFLCLKIESTEKARMGRLIDRDGGLHNWNPDDDTERHADELKYHYVVTNNSRDSVLFLQIESLINRYFQRQPRELITSVGQSVRIIDERVYEFWETGVTVGEVDGLKLVTLASASDITKRYRPHDLMKI